MVENGQAILYYWSYYCTVEVDKIVTAYVSSL